MFAVSKLQPTHLGEVKGNDIPCDGTAPDR